MFFNTTQISSTPFSEYLYRNIPSLFFNKNSYLFDDQYSNLFYQLEQKKIYYNTVHLCSFMKQDKIKSLTGGILKTFKILD